MTETNKSKSEKEESLFPNGSLSVWPPLLRINNRGPDYYLKARKTVASYSDDLYLLSPKDKMENLTGYLYDKQTRLQHKTVELEWLAFLASKEESLLELYVQMTDISYGPTLSYNATNTWGGPALQPYSYEKLIWLVQGLYPFYDDIVEFSKEFETNSASENLLPKKTMQVFITFKALLPKNSYWREASKANPALKSPSSYKITSLSYEEASEASYEAEKSEKLLIKIKPKTRGFIIDGVSYDSIYDVPKAFRSIVGGALIEFSNILPRKEAGYKIEQEQEGWFFYESVL